jgi:hypothetical protein
MADAGGGGGGGGADTPATDDLQSMLMQQLTELLRNNDGAAAACAYQTGVQSCIIDNIIVDGCSNVTIGCDVTGTLGRDCSRLADGSSADTYVDVAAQVMENTVNKLTGAAKKRALQALLAALKSQVGGGAGGAGSTTDKSASTDESMMLELTTGVKALVRSTCMAVQNAYQSVYLPYIVITGPHCDQVVVNAFVKLDQKTQCATRSLQALLRDAGYGGKGSTPPVPPPAAKPTIAGLTPTQFWVIVAMVAVVVLLVAFFTGWLSREA